MASVKLETFIKSVIFLRLFCGLYYKLSSNKITVALTKIYCTFVAKIIITIFVLFIKNLKVPFQIYLSFGLMCSGYLTNVVFSAYFDGDNFMKYFSALKEIRNPQDFPSFSDIKISIILLFFFASSRIFNYAAYSVSAMFTFQNPFPYNIYTTTAFIGSIAVLHSLVNSTRMMTFELLWRRMAILRKRLEQDLLKARRFENEGDILKNNLKQFLNTYKSILDTIRISEKPMKLGVTVVTNNKSSYLNTNHIAVNILR
ncbi:hypothetical protein B5X24_HaOG200897 [Helicoverpa armigera]|nr:hypothetical protein B5X24_HaOG200897 [Helicoverpa armigera]